MLLSCYDKSCLSRTLNNCLFIKRFNCMNVDYLSFNTFIGKAICRIHGLRHHYTCCEDCNILALFQHLGFSEFNTIGFVIENGNCRSSQPNVSGTVKSNSLPYQFFCTNSVARIDNRHARDSSHQSKILKCLVTRSVFTYSYTCMACTNFNISRCISD